MQSRERVIRRIKAIKLIKDPLEAIHELADLTFDIGEEACQERKSIRSLTEANRTALLGNGNHEHSIMFRLGETVRVQAEMMDSLTKIQKALIGDLDDPDCESIIGRLRDVERVIATINRLTWAAITVFLGQVILFIWAFFIH